MNETSRYFVLATEEQLIVSNVNSATPVEYFPDRREILALDEPDGLNQWIVYATLEWAKKVAASKSIKSFELGDKDLEEITTVGAIVTKERAAKIFTDKMQHNFNRIMVNIGYGKQQQGRLC